MNECLFDLSTIFGSTTMIYKEKEIKEIDTSYLKQRNKKFIS